MSYFDHLKIYKDNIALVTSKEKIKYNRLLSYSDDISKNIEERTLVILICKNSVESIAAYISFVKSGCVVLLFDNKLNEESFKNLINTYEPNYVFLPKNKFSCKINYENIFDFSSYELLKKQKYKKHELNNELALLMPTSGSMGASKFVRQSYENIKCNIHQIDDYLKIKHSDSSITTMPMNYTYGLSIIHTHLAKGASLALSEDGLMSKQFWNIFQAAKVTNFGGVPYIYEILKKLNFKEKKIENLEYLTQAGGKLSKELSKDFIETCLKKNLRMIFMYGQTEATSRMSFLPWEFAKKKVGSIGQAILGGKFWLKNSKGDIIKKNDEIGELVYEGKNVTLGYSKTYKDLSNGDDNKGLLYTGDLATRDNDNFYYIVGRSNRILKIFGIRINLDDLETAIKNLGYECACVEDNNKIRIFLTKKFNNEILTEKIYNISGVHKSAINLLFIKEIPRNNAGKVSYSELN